jgi:beta-lactamase superfamily II metal-dependent hydrolase
MSIIKSFSVGLGDLYYINHNSPNFTIIDCNITSDNQEDIVAELTKLANTNEITRFISTHPDEDHFHGLKYLDEQINILNFYCVNNNAVKKIITDDFQRYCELRDSKKAFYLYRGCRRKWMNESGEDKNGKQISSSGINILWPILGNQDFKDALESTNNGNDPNNISPIIKYELNSGAKVIWMGDLEQEFMEKIIDEITLPDIDILFAPHHGRDSGKVPKKWLDQMRPRIVIIGEAPSRDLNYYKDYNTITQLSAGDIIFDCVSEKIHIYVSNEDYSVDFLDNEKMTDYDYYLGTLNLT